MLYGGAPHLVAAAYAIIGYFMVLAGTALAVVSAGAAFRGEAAGLMPLPFVIIAFSLAVHALRCSAEAIRSVMR